MKKFLVIFGSFILFIITFGTLFKLMHWPGAGPLLVIGMSLFCFFFLPCFFIERMISNRTGLSITLNILALLSSFMIFTGVMFKLMHWPGAGPLIVFGCLIFVFPTLILYVVQQFREKDRKFGEFWRFLTMAILVCVFLMFWGTNVSRNIIYSFFKVEDATLQTNKDLEEYNAFLLSEINSRVDSNAVYVQAADVITTKSVELLQSIDLLKAELINTVDRDPASDAVNNHWNINAPDNYDIPTHLLAGPSGKGRYLYDVLIDLVTTLRQEIEKLPIEEKERELERLGNFGINLEPGPQLMEGFNTWEDAMFYQQTVAGALAVLSSVQNEVLNAQFKALRTIRRNMK